MNKKERLFQKRSECSYNIAGNKTTDNKLRRFEDKYRTIADFTCDWEIWISLDGNFQYVSPSCERITGYTADQFMEQPGLLRNIIIPEDQTIWDTHRHEAAQGTKLRGIQFRIKRRDGKITWIESACMPVIDKDNKIQGFRASNWEITKRKKVENYLRFALAEIAKYKEKLEVESAYLSEEITLACNYENIIDCSNALQYVIFKINQIATAAEYYSTKLLHVSEVFFVTHSDVMGPMGEELVHVQSKDAAETFKQEHHAKDIFTFEQVISDIISGY